MRRDRKARRLAVVTAAAMGLMSLTAVAAADEDSDNRASPSLTVHRLRGMSTKPGNGEELKPAPELLPIGGARIELHQMNCAQLGDLTTDAQVQEAYQMMEKIGPVPTKDQILSVEGCSLSSMGTKTTTETGEARWADLARGIYFGEETFTPSEYEVADPFVVMVPITSADGTKYNSNVHVYPKSNRLGSEVGKDVIAQPNTAHGLVTYKVRSEIHRYTMGMKYFAMTDKLDSRLKLLGNHKVFLGDRELIIDRDYTVETVDSAKRDIIMRLTESGLYKYNLAPPYNDMTWQFDTEMNGKGLIANTAIVWENKDPLVWQNGGLAILPCPADMQECLSTPAVETRYGSANIINTIYKTNAPGVGSATEIRYEDVSSGVDAAAAKTKACKGILLDTEITGNDGKATTVGIRSSEYLYGRKLMPDEKGYRYYCAIQITAPPGTELMRDPLPFVITGDSESALYKTNLVFQNVKQNAGFQLPLTGGIGLGIFGLVSVILMAYAVIKSRSTKREVEESA